MKCGGSAACPATDGCRIGGAALAVLGAGAADSGSGFGPSLSLIRRPVLTLAPPTGAAATAPPPGGGTTPGGGADTGIASGGGGGGLDALALDGSTPAPTDGSCTASDGGPPVDPATEWRRVSTAISAGGGSTPPVAAAAIVTAAAAVVAPPEAGVETVSAAGITAGI